MRTIIGFGVGYVLGARAGRPSYEQMKAWWLDLVESDTARSLVSGVGGSGLDAAKGAAATGLAAASRQLRKLTD